MPCPTPALPETSFEPETPCPYPVITGVAVAVLLLHTSLIYRVGALSGPLNIPTLTASLVFLSVPWAIAALARSLANGRRCIGQAGWLARWLPLVFLVGGLTGYVLSPGFLFSHPLSALGFRHQHTETVREWADSVLQTPHTNMPMAPGTQTLLADSAIPTEIHKLHRGGRLWVRVIGPPGAGGFFVKDPNTYYLALGWDEDIVGWGLLIGPKNFRAHETKDYRVRFLAPGIYRWDPYYR